MLVSTGIGLILGGIGIITKADMINGAFKAFGQLAGKTFVNIVDPWNGGLMIFLGLLLIFAGYAFHRRRG